MNIFLVGPMGSGKSSLGKKLAKSLDKKFIDTDREIEKKENKTINDIFASDYGWSATYQLMALLMFIGVIGVVIQPEQINTELEKLTFQNSIIEPLRDFFSRFGLYLASFLLLLIATYRLTDIVMGPMASPFYLEKGYSLKEIGYVVKVVAVIAAIVGFFVGGLLVKRLGVKLTLIIGAVLVLIKKLSLS